MTFEYRFWSKVDKNGPIPTHRPELGPCWLWTAATTKKSYGRFSSQQAHRVSYELSVGRIPSGLVTDHLCRVRHCVNPTHLEPVTVAENIRRGVDIGKAGGQRGGATMAARQRAKTHCPKGHPYEGANLYLQPDGGRRCRACHRLRDGYTGEGTGATNKRKTHCPYGHPYSGPNLYINPKGKRKCRACGRAAHRAKRSLKGA